MEMLDDLKYFLDNFESAPTFEQMPRRTLNDKGAAGPTGAHFIEEIHTPLNLAYISVTTGTTAFQNITGVTHNELNARIEAGKKALKQSGLKRGDSILITYPPLVNVFCKDALEDYDILFLERSCRDAMLFALIKEKPKAILGESSFMRAGLEDMIKIDLLKQLSKETSFIAAGTPLDTSFPALVNENGLGKVHDLYGCQEFGWLALDGIPLRSDISLIPANEKEGYYHFVVGGLPTGDCFPIIAKGHICGDGDGDIITYSCIRSKSEAEPMITHSTARSADTVYSLARTILRIKGRVMRVSPELVTDTSATRIIYPISGKESFEVAGTEKTTLFDALMDAQLDYQSQGKTDPVWLKDR